MIEVWDAAVYETSSGQLLSHRLNGTIEEPMAIIDGIYFFQMAAAQNDNEKACLFSKTVIELIQIFTLKPNYSECPLEAVLTWNKLGPFDFEHLVMEYPPRFKSFDIRVPVQRVSECYMG